MKKKKIQMAFLLRISRGLVSVSTNRFQPIHIKILLLERAESVHSDAKEPKSDEIVDTVCDSLRRGGNWDFMSGRFDSVELTDSVVEKVLLELKEPVDARRALSFFHWSARRQNFEHGIRSYCIAVHILVRARMLMDTRALLESVIRRNTKDGSLGFMVVDSLLSTYKSTLSCPFVFDLLIQTYSKLKMFKMAFDVCRYLDEHGFSCSLISFNTLIHVTQKSDQNHLVWKIYEFMIQKRTYPNEVTIRNMISALCKEGKLQRYIEVLDRIHGKRCSTEVIVNTCLVFRIIEEGRDEEGIILVKRMLQKNMILDNVAYTLIVFTKCKTENLDSARNMYEEMLKRGFHANSFMHTLLIRAHCKVGQIEEANRLMQEMESIGLKPYDETFNFLIEGFSRAGRLDESLGFFEKMMKAGLLPSCSAFSEMVGRLSEIGNVKQANAILTTLLDRGFQPDEVTYSHLIDGYGKIVEFQEVLKLYYEMEYRAQFPSLMIYTSVIRSLCRCGKLTEAEKYLKVMKDRSLTPSVSICDMLIASHCKKDNTARALQLYDEMVREMLKPSCQSFHADSAEG